MCGIFAVVRRPQTRSVPQPEEIIDLLESAAASLASAVEIGPSAAQSVPLRAAATAVEAADQSLRGVPGVRALLENAGLQAQVANVIAGIEMQISAIEKALDHDATSSHSLVVGADLENLNAALLAAKDAAWAVRRDRLRAAIDVAEIIDGTVTPAAIGVALSIHQALSALDRLEVRGRDSAGLHLLVQGHGIDLDSPAMQAVINERGADSLFGSMALRTPDGHLSFVYKAAAEIGELGDNTREIRTAILRDQLLRQALLSPDVQASVLSHTRWASVGIISQPNAHPLNSDETDGVQREYVTAVLNGDVDNFADLKAAQSLSIADEITTDAKVIPTLTARAMEDGTPLVEAFRSTVNELEGSVAIAVSAAKAPNDILVALRGSGQALYVGCAEDAYIVASEPYGVVEETSSYLRLDGEVPAIAENPASRGQIISLRGDYAGDISGIERWAYDGTPIPVSAKEFADASITTRDIDRGDFDHFLLKEISEAPASFRKTLRGKIIDSDGLTRVALGEDVLSKEIKNKLANGEIRKILAIGQGTAAVAARSLSEAISAFDPQSPLRVETVLATELSGFQLSDQMNDTIVVAVSQSGTTTDTNRTVDLVRARGAHVVAIVNRRNSDLTDRADGVLYTSDGRDVEMSVASTKAFYSQIAACYLLAAAITEASGASGNQSSELLSALREIPQALETTFALRPQIAVAAQRLAPSRRYWAIVGNGANRIAAEEIRIKLSELCYKSIACDGTEDKKHIDLSSEPLILVCATGLSGSTADDVAKEVAIYRAHKAAPVVVATEGDERFASAFDVINVPAVHRNLAFILSAMVGHLFGYEAALAIDSLAFPLRQARAAIDESVAAGNADGEKILADVRDELALLATKFFDSLRNGEYNGNLEASTAVKLSVLWRFALGSVPLDAYQVEFGKVGTPGVVLEDFTAALSVAIDELTRPIDAIKHQAKTVTVGISRSDETLLQVPLVRAVLATGASRDQLTYATLRTLAALEPLVAEVLGATRYAIEGRVDPSGIDDATLVIVDRTGIARELRSRVADDPQLRGTKRLVAAEKTVYVARGLSDGRTVIIVPEMKDGESTGLSLMHVRLHTDLSLPALRSVLQGYRNRYAAIKHAVTETEPVFRDDLLSDIPIIELMTEPVNQLAEHWRS